MYPNIVHLIIKDDYYFIIYYTCSTVQGSEVQKRRNKDRKKEGERVERRNFLMVI